ncbi:Exonuclease III [Agromyces sp. CF514]|uniref:endonuclease/exonuclease/phosphatase family protein n=1 Tax=Agromyces sp. CF514 TaxID=1881031 RepID=UPI0008E02EEE|nr:endonuclease/exonuclease/phosphatase family protein [Agromyces sp. CF514]SFR84669.1 Exonuclease III [Agromyces sp. CF514]
MRIATLNLRHGGGPRIPSLLAQIERIDADVLVLTEFRSSGVALIDGLHSFGYETTTSLPPDSSNGIALASRSTIDRSWSLAQDLDPDLDPHRLWAVETMGLNLVGVYLPQRKLKLPYWDAVISAAASGHLNAGVLIGDWNTGTNTLDKAPAGAGFDGANRLAALEATGYVDPWRRSHPDRREYSWFSTRGNGFRVDHAYVHPSLLDDVLNAFYDQIPLAEKATDHAALILEFSEEFRSKPHLPRTG